MFFPNDEKPMGFIEAKRKGKKGAYYQAPCKIGISVLDNDRDTIIIRTEDANGTAPIVICLTKEQIITLTEFVVDALG